MIVVGDIHGQIKLMENVIKEFKDRKLLFAGDIIDRGDGKNCLKLLKESGARSLLGNHEQMAIEFLRAPKENLITYYNIWMANGGLETLKSFDIKENEPEDMQKALNEDQLMSIIKEFSIYKLIDDIMVVHAGIDDGYLSDRSESFIWSRTSIDDIENKVANSFKNDFPHIKFMVTGHNIVNLPTVYVNYSILQLRIDLGSFYSKSVGAFDSRSGEFYKITENDLLICGNIKKR